MLRPRLRNGCETLLISAEYNSYGETNECALDRVKVGIEPPKRDGKLAFPVWVGIEQLQAHARAGELDGLGHQQENANPSLKIYLPEVDLAEVPYELASHKSVTDLLMEEPPF